MQARRRKSAGRLQGSSPYEKDFYESDLKTTGKAVWDEDYNKLYSGLVKQSPLVETRYLGTIRVGSSEGEGKKVSAGGKKKSC